MRRIVLAGLLLLAGCCYVGPRERGPLPPRVVDDPRLSIPEQQRRGRNLLALPEPSPNVGPRTYMEPPDIRGGRQQ